MVYINTPREAEFNAVARMRSLGYLDAHVCEPGADGGVDAISERALGQVKHKGSQVGRPDIQRLYGARGDRTHLDLLFFSASGYSRHAVDYADEAGIMLFTYDLSGELEPANDAAYALAESGYDGFEYSDDEYVENEAPRPLDITDRGPAGHSGRLYNQIGVCSAVLGTVGLVAAERWSTAIGLLLWTFALFCWIVGWSVGRSSR
ncbi:restriction endonuclease [Aldersonia kunmingensis]|uniref:restriction endonuclease n=1 Tax=Aldersonia kunmingensis TaxID=408066 RepID=UPI000830A73C|nr:restriction endonuclease [Aldersonia kunmingensis]